MIDTQAWREAAKLAGLTLLGVGLLIAFGVLSARCSETLFR